jgi:CHAT domain-containing protein/Flp pilus assembly protein TadD
VFLLIACGLACNHPESPQASYQHAYETFVHGHLKQSQDEAHLGWARFQDSNPELAWKFRILEANSLLWQGMFAQALTTVDSPPTRPTDKGSLIEISAIKGAANARLHNFPEAEETLGQAAQICQTSSELQCGDVIRARGVLALQHGRIDSAEQLFQQSLQFARARLEPFLELTSLLNLSVTSLQNDHFDEAVDWAGAAYQAAMTLRAEGIAQGALGNLGWAYYKLGDSEKSLELSLEAAKLAGQTGNVISQLAWITAAGYVYANRGDFGGAKRSYLEALDLANKTGGKEDIYASYRALALVSVEDGKLEDAREYSDKAIEISKKDNNRLDELYPLLVKGLIAARSHDDVEAERIFHEVATDPKRNSSLKFRAEHALAQLYEDEGHSGAAEREYQIALGTIEDSRSSLKRDESKLPFSNNARQVYDDYVHFLVANNKKENALRWADFSRARTLAEGLGYLPKGGSVEPPASDAKQIARRAGATLLFYWLGEKQSYLWAITPRKIEWFPLPPGKTIDAAVQRYGEALQVQDVLASADRDGQSLYQMLVGPAQELLPKNAKVFVIPDGSLNNLNFETLIVSESTGSEPKAPAPKLHYWIEDATIANASSLRVLSAVGAYKRKHERSLLIVGNSVAPNHEYRELPHAAEQMKSVESHFSAAKKILSRENATPSAYLASSPEKFSHIHFVAHGKANQLSPLDSEIELSRDSAQDDSFKLYAREIVDYSKKNPLQAELVTISACYSAGDNPYSGEGLVGLSWAFIRAGARNVAAALWEVSNASTVQLMDKFYDELEKGASPDDALRTAKLSLLRGKEYHNPFYWASFQLYVRLG